MSIMHVQFTSFRPTYESCFAILNTFAPDFEWFPLIAADLKKLTAAEIQSEQKLIVLMLEFFIKNAHLILGHFVNDKKNHVKPDLVSKRLHWIAQSLANERILPKISGLAEDLELLSMRFGLFQNIKEASGPDERYKFEQKPYGKRQMLREVSKFIKNLPKGSERKSKNVIKTANFQNVIRCLLRFVIEQHFGTFPQKSKQVKYFCTIYKCAANKGFVFRNLVDKMKAFPNKIEYLQALQILYSKLEPDSQTEFLIGLFDFHLFSLRSGPNPQPPHVFTDKKTLKYCRVGSPVCLSLIGQKTNPECKKVIRSVEKALPNLGKAAASLSEHLLVYKLFFDSSMENGLPKSFVFAEFVDRILKSLGSAKAITAESKTFLAEIKDKIRLFDSHRIINMSILTWIREQTARKDPRDLAVNSKIFEYLLPKPSKRGSLGFVYECGDEVGRLHDYLLCKDSTIDKEEFESFIRERFQLLASIVANWKIKQLEKEGHGEQKQIESISQSSGL